MNVPISFPVRMVGSERWFSLQFMGIKRLDAVSYSVNTTQKYSFAGGHRHRLTVLRDDIHLKFPEGSYDVPVDITDVKPLAPKRRHDKG